MKMRIIGILIAGLVSFVAVNSFAVTSATLQATMNMKEQLRIVSNTPLNFGDVNIPISGTEQKTIDHSSSDRALISILGPANQIVSIFTAKATKCSDPGLTLGAFTIGTQRTIAGDGKLTLSYGATLTVESTAKAGPQTCNYTVTLDF